MDTKGENVSYYQRMCGEVLQRHSEACLHTFCGSNFRIFPLYDAVLLILRISLLILILAGWVNFLKTRVQNMASTYYLWSKFNLKKDKGQQ